MRETFSTPSLRSRIEGAALLAVIALLCVLAVVQHRWLGAIAEAERQKLVEESTDKATAIAQEVDRELTRVFLELRLDAKALPGRGAGAGVRDGDKPAGPSFAEQFERWRAESPHAGLVKGVFVAERSQNEPTRLLRFDPSTRGFVEEAWPEGLSSIRTVLDERRDGVFRTIGVSGLPPVSLPIMASLPPVMADVPALLSPVMDVVVSERKSDPNVSAKMTQIREMFMRHTGLGPVEIIWLDAAYLREKIVAAIAQSKLGVDGPFEWSVVKVKDGATVAGTTEDAGAAVDAKAPLLRLRIDDLDRSLLRGVLPGLSEAAAESSVRFVVQLGRPGSPGQPNAGPPAPWTLQLRHREGSIDAAVRSQQRRNTALSASILGVLGLSAGLVFFSARRLRAIATQQVEFVASVSHELRTPLAVIRSAADNLADGVVQDKEQTKRYGSLIRDESVRLADMVEHVLEFAGADSPGRSERGPMDAAEAVRAAVKSMESLAADRAGKVAVDVPPEPLRVNGDLSNLTRAVSNLLGNALKYGGDSPRVTVRARAVQGAVEINVSDLGPGLSPSEMPRLFEPFYRGQRASEAHIPGSGLGLALVKRIVESHGGRVSAASENGGGAVFTIVLPAVRDAA
jgi:signal transduction histidine kinase